MSTENIDVVIRSAGTRRVVRDINDIADAALAADNRVSRLQQQLNALNTSSFQNQLRAVQGAIAGLGQNSLLAQLQAQLNATTAQLQALNAQLNQTNAGMNRVARGGAPAAIQTLGQLRNTITAVIAALGVNKILEWADAWTSAAGKILVFSESQEQANLIMDRILGISQEVRQPLQSMATLYSRLSISAKELGVSQNEMLKFTSNVGKVLAIQGTPMQQARGMLLQLSQAMGEVRVRGQEFNSMMENAPLLLQIASKHIKGTHDTLAGLRRLMLDGKLTSKELFEGIMAGSTEIDERFKKTQKTFEQGFIIIINGLEAYLGKLVASTGASAAFNTIAQAIAGNMDTIGKGLLIAGGVLALYFAPAILTAMATGIAAVATGIGAIATFLLANPFVALVVGAAAASLFADKINIGVDSITTLADVYTAVGPTLTQFWNDRFKEIDSFFGLSTVRAQGMLTDLDLSVVGISRSIAKFLDSIAAGIIGLAYGIAEAFKGLPTIMDEIGKRMFNAIVTHIENIVNAAITGMNKLGALIGKSIDPVHFMLAKVDEHAFSEYGKHIVGAMEAGVKFQGHALENIVNKVADKAAAIAKARSFEALRRSEILSASLDRKTGGAPPTGKPDKKALNAAADAAKGEIRELLDKYRQGVAEQTELERHKEAMLKASYQMGLMNYADYTAQLSAMQDANFVRARNEMLAQQTAIQDLMGGLKAKLKAKGMTDKQIDNVVTDLQTKLQGLAADIDKLGNKNQERLANNLAQALTPARELVENSKKELDLAELNTKQEIEKLNTKKNLNQLSERDQFIQTETNKLLNTYEDKLQRIESVRNEMFDKGIFDDLTDPATAKALSDIQAVIARIYGDIDRIKGTAPSVLGKAFDAGEVEKLATSVQGSLRDAIMAAGSGGGKALRKTLTDLLKKPFTIVLDAVLKPISQAIASVMQPMLASLSRGISGLIGSFLGGGRGPVATGVNGASGALGLASNGMTLYNTGSSLLGGTTFANAAAGWAGASGAAGATTVATAAESGAAFEGAMAAGGTFASTGATAAGASGAAYGALSAIPVWGWIAIAALSAWAIFGGKGGGPKVEGSFGGMPDIVGSGGNELDSTTQQSIQGLTKTFEGLAKSLGGNSAGISFGLGVSTDPKGTAPSFVDMQMLKNGQLMSRDLNTSVGRSEEELKHAIAQQTVNIVLDGLRESGVDNSLLDYWYTISKEMDAEGKLAAFEVVGQLAQIRDAFRDMSTAFPNLSSVSIEATNHIAELAGGIDTLMNGMNAFYDNFFSDEEKRQQLAKNISGTLTKNGMPMSQSDVLMLTKDDFKGWVQGLDMTTETGQAAFATLMSVAAAFADLKKEATGAVAAVDSSRTLTDLRQELLNSYEKEKQALESTRDTMDGFVQSFTDFRSGMEQSSLSPLTPGQKYSNAAADYSSLMSEIARGGKPAEEAMGKFDNVSKAFLEASQNFNASGGNYQNDFNRVMQDSQVLLNTATQQRDFAEMSLKVLDNQVYHLASIDDNIRTVKDIITQLNSIGGASINPTGTVMNLYNELFKREPDAGGLDYWRQRIAGGESIDSVKAAMMSSGEYLAGHAGGLSNVPYNNYLFRAHKGEAILTGREASDWRSGGGSGNMGGFDLSALLRRLDLLCQEVSELREQHADGVSAEIEAMYGASSDNATKVTAGVVTAGERAMTMERRKADAVLE